jgi:putative redox protein
LELKGKKLLFKKFSKIIKIMVTVESKYLGDLRVSSKHLQSGVEIQTDAPVDNQGKGESFSPTDLLCTALASCMMTIMGIEAKRLNIELKGTTIKTTKFMNLKPRKVSRIKIEIYVPSPNISKEHQNILKEAAINCPVALSLHPELIQDINFFFG